MYVWIHPLIKGSEIKNSLVQVFLKSFIMIYIFLGYFLLFRSTSSILIVHLSLYKYIFVHTPLVVVKQNHCYSYHHYIWTKNAPSYVIHVWNNKKWIFYTSHKLSVQGGIFQSGFHIWENELWRNISLHFKFTINIYILTWKIFSSDISIAGTYIHTILVRKGHCE